MRLAFAVAVHLEPEILLVDEVLSVRDVAFQKKCLGKMNQVEFRRTSRLQLAVPFTDFSLLMPLMFVNPTTCATPDRWEAMWATSSHRTVRCC
jgi:hypothetical protein